MTNDGLIELLKERLKDPKFRKMADENPEAAANALLDEGILCDDDLAHISGGAASSVQRNPSSEMIQQMIQMLSN